MITRNHWLAAAMLAALICGVSFGEEAKVKTNDQRLLVLCKDPEATPKAIEALLKAGADIEARSKYGLTPLLRATRDNSNPDEIQVLLNAGAKDKYGNTAVDHAKNNVDIYKTAVYQKLIELQHE